MDQSTRYADPQAHERYMEFDGREGVVTYLLPVSTDEAFDAWFDIVWKKPMLQEVRPGQGRGHVGHVRQVQLGLQEEILSAGLPQPEDKDAVLSVLYKVKEFGPVPLVNHLGFVSFVPDTSGSTPKTLIIWKVKVVPSTLGFAFFCGGAGIRLTLCAIFKVFLSDLGKSFQERQQVSIKKTTL
ncbi:hypothetical protein Poli38472_004881 [Pythium oligandrum]|uniref:Uncharacterized protein n=1 Tax=Pythium oligandrum TaxID=41045 RepID=A0A8K1CAW6_PYTOL|nr:hypothetical protein Poli38472_004881 [Pythium oligandrum]|eukprot:TMW59812.1 hypothetical protein Poli38472_004881 [Pythium oligandrum]